MKNNYTNNSIKSTKSLHREVEEGELLEKKNKILEESTGIFNFKIKSSQSPYIFTFTKTFKKTQTFT